MACLFNLPTAADCLNENLCNGNVSVFRLLPKSLRCNIPSILQEYGNDFVSASYWNMSQGKSDVKFFGGQLVLRGRVRTQGGKARRGRGGSHTEVRDYISLEEKWETLVTFVWINPADLQWVIQVWVKIYNVKKVKTEMTYPNQKPFWIPSKQAPNTWRVV